MADSAARTSLSAAQQRAAQTLLGRAWGEPAELRAATPLWDRDHVFRLDLGGGRSAVLKRRGGRTDHGREHGFGAELAALEYLNGMPVPVAPRLLGADGDAGVLIMEELGPGGSLADSLMRRERERAQADLVAYARALAQMHVWSMARPGELEALRRRYVPGVGEAPALMGLVRRNRDAFLDLAGSLGLPVAGAAAEIDALGPLLRETGHQGLVHNDACPDNVRITADGACRIFDFEVSGWGSIALDAVFLVAPFPSCWCFASLPGEAAVPALGAYRTTLDAAGIRLGADWDTALTAALACWLIARGRQFVKDLADDPMWGTTTMRPRLLAWLRSFLQVAAGTGNLPRLQAVAAALLEQIPRRWPGVAVPDYPAFAGPASVLAQVPDGWQPGD
jgi:Ser/Thr protein kinase RdoA (MazF antagonist)